jgi:hypothetical protein
MKKTYLALVAFTLAIMGTIFVVAPGHHTAGFGSPLNDPTLFNTIRSFGGFYLGFAAFLVVALCRKNLIDGALISVVLVMIGLLAGRAVSLMVEGIPGPNIWRSVVVELVFSTWGLIILWRSNQGLSIDARQN